MTEFTEEFIAKARKLLTENPWKHSIIIPVQLEMLDHIERQAKRIAELTKERDYLDARCAEFEGFSRNFIELEYDNVLRERLEKILYKEGDEETKLPTKELCERGKHLADNYIDACENEDDELSKIVYYRKYSKHIVNCDVCKAALKNKESEGE